MEGNALVTPREGALSSTWGVDVSKRKKREPHPDREYKGTTCSTPKNPLHLKGENRGITTITDE